MSKAPPNKKVPVDLSRYSKSTFTLTFAIEILGIDVWHDCNEGWIDLGPCVQALKIQYQLYPEQNFELDILIWPHVAKILCGLQYGYVRTWQFLERRWFAFSIRHAFPVRILELMNHVVTVNCTMGFGALSNNAKNDKNIEALLPSLKFGERRYFGPVLEKEVSLEKIIQDIIWNAVEEHIPASYLDGVFNTPQHVTDIRHKDAILFNVREIILNNNISSMEDLTPEPEDNTKPKDRRESKILKDKEKKKVVEVQKEKFMISLPGNTILAGTGKIIAFEITGDRPPDQSEVVALISSNNLPAQDDYPIIFINIGNLYDTPINELKKARISRIYTRWKLHDEEHDSEKQYIKFKNPINFNDHHTIPLQFSKASEITATFLNNPFEIQLRGVRNPELLYNQSLFGNDKNDRNFDKYSSKYTYDDENDILIGVTKIDASSLAQINNTVVRREFSIFPPKGLVENLGRVAISSNDINAARAARSQEVIVVQPSVVLDAHMTLDVSIGLVGCKPRDFTPAYSRMYCLACDSEAITAIVNEIKNINQNIGIKRDRNDLLTGFALNTAEIVIFYIEGQKDGSILKIWDIAAKFYPTVKPVFSCSERYIDRIYPEMLSANMPFHIISMIVPLNALLGCPQAYVKPALPLPAKSALLKFGRLIASKSKVIPFKSDMPSMDELESFKLELCVMPPSV